MLLSSTLARRQRRADLRPDQSRPARGGQAAACSRTTSSISGAPGSSGTPPATSGWRSATSTTEPPTLRLEIAFAADFADIFEVRGTERARRGRYACRRGRAPTRVTLAYTGPRRRAARDPPALRAGARPARRASGRCSSSTSRRATRQTVFVEIGCGAASRRRPPPRRAFFAGLPRRAPRAAGTSRRAPPSIATSNELFNEACAARSPTSTC